MCGDKQIPVDGIFCLVVMGNPKPFANLVELVELEEPGWVVLLLFEALFVYRNGVLRKNRC